MSMTLRHLTPRLTFTLLTAFLCCWADEGHGGSNEGFRPGIVTAKRFKNPVVGDLIPIAIRVEGTSQVRQTRIRVGFDPAFFEFIRFERGNHPADEGFQAFESEAVEDGVSVASGGGSLFEGKTDVSGGGLLGTMVFRLIQEIGTESQFLSVLSVRVALSADDFDVRRFDAGIFGVGALLDSPNKIFDVAVEATDRSAVVTWRTRDQGLDDVVTVEQIDENGSVVATIGDFEPPYQDRAPEALEALEALRSLEAAGIDILTADDQVIRDFLGIPSVPFGPDPFPPLLAEARVIVKQFRARLHVVPIPPSAGLQADTNYKLTILSTGLSGRESPLEMTRFRTRGGPISADWQPMGSTFSGDESSSPSNSRPTVWLAPPTPSRPSAAEWHNPAKSIRMERIRPSSP